MHQTYHDIDKHQRFQKRYDIRYNKSLKSQKDRLWQQQNIWKYDRDIREFHSGSVLPLSALGAVIVADAGRNCLKIDLWSIIITKSTK